MLASPMPFSGSRQGDRANVSGATRGRPGNYMEMGGRGRETSGMYGGYGAGGQNGVQVYGNRDTGPLLASAVTNAYPWMAGSQQSSPYQAWGGGPTNRVGVLQSMGAPVSQPAVYNGPPPGYGGMVNQPAAYNGPPPGTYYPTITSLGAGRVNQPAAYNGPPPSGVVSSAPMAYGLVGAPVAPSYGVPGNFSGSVGGFRVAY